MILAWCYVGALAVALVASLVRRVPWPLRVMLLAWTALAALFIGFRDPARDATWLPGVWMPAEIASLCCSAVCLVWMLLRETRHSDPVSRFWLRVGVALLPLSAVATIWLFDRHDTWYWTFVSGRSRFWQAMLLAYFIAWANTWQGRRFTRDGMLCLRVSVVNGLVGSFGPSQAKQAAFRVLMILILAWWVARRGVDRDVPASAEAPRDRAWPRAEARDDGRDSG